MSESKAVPKFGSFKPKARQPATAASHAAHVPSSRHHREERDGRSQRHERLERREEPRRHRSERKRDDLPPEVKRPRISRSPEPNERRHISDETTLVDEAPKSELFFVDRRGDSNNVQFGTLHRYSTPSYTRSGNGRVIGISSFRRIDRDASDEHGIALVPGQHDYVRKHKRLLSSKRGISGAQEVQIIPQTVTNGIDDTNADFIAFESNDGPRSTSELADTNAEPLIPDYRSIEGKAKLAHLEEDDNTSLLDADASPDPGLSVRRENNALFLTARASPSDWPLWLALLSHQEKLVRSTNESAIFSSAERRLLTELRLSILNEAGKTITKGKAGREHLLLAIIEEGRLVWDSSRLTSKWEEATSECPTSSLIWMKYMDFVQCESRRFNFDECKNVFVRCLELVRHARGDQDDDHGDIDKITISILLRLTNFIHDAGYGELAVAIWQAVLELRFFTAADESLDAFCDFWDSEVPRIGEENARGWKASQASETLVRRTPATRPLFLLDHANVLQNFAEEEFRISAGFSLPASVTNADQQDDDPYRCVMSTDLRDVVANIGSALPKFLLLDGMLCFFGMPALPYENDAGVWPSVRAEAYNRAHIDPDRELTRSLQPGEVVLRSQVETLESLFAGAFDRFAETAPQELARFTDRLLTALVGVETNDVLAAYFVAFKQRMFPGEAYKTAKAFCKKRTSSIALYNAYALMEASNGRNSKARDAWNATLRLRATQPALVQDDAILLRHSAAVTCLSQVNDVDALTYLLDMTPGKISADTLKQPGRLLSARGEFTDSFDRMLLKDRQSLAVLHADCLGLLSYLTSDHFDLGSVLPIYRKYSLLLRKMPLANEALLQGKAGLIQLHLDRHHSYRPAMLVNELEQDLGLFPNNSILLTLYARVAEQDRLRRLVREQKAQLASDKPVPWSIRLATELHRSANDDSGSTRNSIRAIFSNMMRGESQLQHDPHFWHSWIQYEIGLGETERARQIFLRGLQMIPWDKSFVIRGLRYFVVHGGLSESEMQSVHMVLVDRGLRIIVELETDEGDSARPTSGVP